MERQKTTVVDLLKAIEPHDDSLRSTAALVREGSDFSYDNAVSALIDRLMRTGAGGRDSMFTRLFADEMSERLAPEALRASFDDILRQDQDLLWLEDLPAGGFAANTPHGRIIMGAESSSFSQREIDDAILAVFAAPSGIRTDAPILRHLDMRAVVEGETFPFDDEAVTIDGEFRVERLNNYEVMIEGYRNKLWLVSLIDQFSKRVAEISGALDYSQAWESLSHDLYFHAEKILMKLERVCMRPEEIAAKDDDALSTAESIAKAALPLNRLFRTFKGFRENEALKGQWERAFTIGLIDHITDRLPWIDLAGESAEKSGVRTLSRILGNADTAESCRGIFCPLSLMRSLSADSGTHGWLDLRIDAPQGVRITARNNRQLQRLASRLIYLMGSSHAFDETAPAPSWRPPEPARVEVSWLESQRKLDVRDLTKSRSAFAALDPESPGRNELDRLAQGLGGNIDYFMGAISINIPAANGPSPGNALMSGMNFMLVKPILPR